MNFRLLSLYFAAAACSFARDWYIAQTPRGSGSGLRAADARDVSFFNDPGSWRDDVGGIGPGDTIHLVGRVTTALEFRASGSPGRVTRLVFEPGAVMSSPAWAHTGAIAARGLSYIEVDGGKDGTIENTANGTHLANQVDSIGVFGQEASFFTVRNLIISNLYVRQPGDDRNNFGVGILDRYNGSHGFTHFVATNNLIHDARIGVCIDYGPRCSDCEVSFNTVYNCNWDGNAGDHGPGASLRNLNVHHNHFSLWRNWDDLAGNTFHHNGFYAWAESGGSLTDVRFHDNQIGPGYSGSQSSAGLFVSGNAGGVVIYNNVLFGSATNDCPADGFIFVWIHNGTQGGAGIYNNTIVAVNQSGVGINVYSGNGRETTHYDIRNNIASGCATAISRFVGGNSTLTADANIGYNLSAGRAYSDSPDSSSRFLTFTQWRALGNDPRGLSSNPLLSERFEPGPHSPAIGSGADLSQYFTTDNAGTPRPPAMSIGAFEGGPSG